MKDRRTYPSLGLIVFQEEFKEREIGSHLCPMSLTCLIGGIGYGPLGFTCPHHWSGVDAFLYPCPCAQTGSDTQLHILMVQSAYMGSIVLEGSVSLQKTSEWGHNIL